MTQNPKAPQITFGVPAYNRPQLLAETLVSIAAQSGTNNFEVIVCDDGNDPQTPAVVNRFPGTHYFYFKNDRPLGAVGNWNECLRRARGDWVMILHEDDTLYPWYLEITRHFLTADIVALSTRVSTGATPPAAEAPIGPISSSDYLPRYFIKSAMTPFPGVLFRREVALKIGGFAEAMGPLADYDFWYRLSQAGRIQNLDTVAAFYRVGAEQWTSLAWPRMLRLAHLLRLRIAREQFKSRRGGKWLARFFSYRHARSYKRRYAQRPTALQRVLQFKRIAGSWLPSGWVWQRVKNRN